MPGATGDDVRSLRAEVASLREELAVARRSAQACSAAESSRSCPADVASAEAAPPAIPVLGVASIFHAEYLLRCFRSIDFAVKTLVLIHNGMDPGVAAAAATLQREQPALRVVHEPENTGCAGGWNRIIAADPNAPWWLVVNDDITFPPGALRNIASRVWARLDTQPDAGHFKFWYQHGASGWSCFALTAHAWRAVGSFDENIFPVYFEDEDYELRLRLAGLRSVHIRDVRAAPATRHSAQARLPSPTAVSPRRTAGGASWGGPPRALSIHSGAHSGGARPAQVLVVHGSEDALEYESGSLTALSNGTGDGALRAAFTSQLVRSGNREYLLAKWGAPKPQPDQPDRRWRTPFIRRLPVSWWQLDAARRRCILSGAALPDDLTSDAVRAQHAACPFDGALAAAAERRLAKVEYDGQH